jgi:hypothetical protein
MNKKNMLSASRLDELHEEIQNVWDKIKEDPSRLNRPDVEKQILKDLRLTNPQKWTRWGSAFF